ncbi:MAG: DNA-directed RNA polymerase subunit omega [Acidobacteria bacterium]|nr:DNA-directed RNA polymerase subunit omega [Acidobacteriota bacterium]
MDDASDLTIATETEPLPDLPSEPAPPIDSRFLFVDVAALRAKQLRRGARVRIGEPDVVHLPKKPERIAMEEVRRGLVYYDVPPPRPADQPQAEA